MPHPRSRDYRVRPHHSSHSTSHPEKNTEPESDSTIDLPDRFDSQGRLLNERDDGSGEKIEEFINRFSKVLF